MAVERIRIRRDVASVWASANPILASAELGLETDTNRMKAGDGATAWISLDYLSLEPPGRLAPFAMGTAPGGYLACDGAAVSRTTYAALFAAISTTWGVGDGSTTFNLPDLRGLGVRGAGSHGSATMANGSAYAGPAVGAIENDQMQGHIHIQGYGATAVLPRYGVVSGLAGARSDTDTGLSTTFTDGAKTSDASDDGTNGTPRTGDETRGAAAGVLWCIKT